MVQFLITNEFEAAVLDQHDGHLLGQLPAESIGQSAASSTCGLLGTPVRADADLVRRGNDQPGVRWSRRGVPLAAGGCCRSSAAPRSTCTVKATGQAATSSMLPERSDDGSGRAQGKRNGRMLVAARASRGARAGLCARSRAADVASDQAAAILVFPKILVDTSTPPNTTRGPIDTLMRVSNTSTSDRSRCICFYVNANGHCKNSPTTICNPTTRERSPCGQTDCARPGWQETDFVVTLTARQPIAWLASRGAAPCDLESLRALPCFPSAVSGQPAESRSSRCRRIRSLASSSASRSNEWRAGRPQRSEGRGGDRPLQYCRDPVSTWRATTRSAFRRSPVPMTATPRWCWVAECVPAARATVHRVLRECVSGWPMLGGVQLAVRTFSSWIISLTARMIRSRAWQVTTDSDAGAVLGGLRGAVVRADRRCSSWCSTSLSSGFQPAGR